MTITEFNELQNDRAGEELTRCCGAQKWVAGMAERRPFANFEEMLAASDQAWSECNEADQLEAFRHHPKIGDVKSLEAKFASTKDWAGNEQSGVSEASKAVIEKLAELNTLYEDRFGFIFIICATGQPADDMLTALEGRMNNSYEEELRIAAAEQHKITEIRLRKLIA